MIVDDINAAALAKPIYCANSLCTRDSQAVLDLVWPAHALSRWLIWYARRRVTDKRGS